MRRSKETQRERERAWFKQHTTEVYIRKEPHWHDIVAMASVKSAAKQKLTSRLQGTTASIVLFLQTHCQEGMHPVVQLLLATTITIFT